MNNEINNKVSIIVKDGLVQAVYGNSENIEVEVIDLDADEADRYDEAMQEYEAVKDQMFHVW